MNEVTCYISGYGDEGLLTFDWKHFPYEDYDDFLWGERGLFKPNSTERIPGEDISYSRSVGMYLLTSNV